MFKREAFPSAWHGQPDTAVSYWSHSLSGVRGSLANRYFCYYKDMPRNGFFWEMFFILGNKSQILQMLWGILTSFQRGNWRWQGDHQPKAATASGKAGWEILPPVIFLIPTGSTRACHTEKWQGGSKQKKSSPFHQEWPQGRTSQT